MTCVRSAETGSSAYAVVMEAKNPEDAPFDTVTSESKTYGEGQSSALTPMGQVESLGGFARGLGRRRVKVLLACFGACVLVLAVLEGAS